MDIIRESSKLRRTIAAKSLSEQELSDQELREHYVQADAQDVAVSKGLHTGGAPEQQEPLSERDTLVTRIEQKINQDLPDKFHSGPLPVKENLFCRDCGYDVSKSLEVVIESDLSARWECHYTPCDLDGHSGKRRGKLSVGPEVILAWDDDYQRRFARHYLYAGLPDVLRQRMLFEEDAEFDAGPDEPILFLKNYISFMPHDKAARKYWNRALDRYKRDLLTHVKEMGRIKVKGSGRPWPPKFITDDKIIMRRASTRKMIEEVYAYVRDQRWAVRPCLEWYIQNPDCQLPDGYKNIIAPILVTLDVDKMAKALDMSPDELWTYMRAMESVGLIQRIAYLKHGHRLWSLGHWQQTSLVNTAARWFLKKDSDLLGRLRAVHVWKQT